MEIDSVIRIDSQISLFLMSISLPFCFFEIVASISFLYNVVVALIDPVSEKQNEKYSSYRLV